MQMVFQDSYASLHPRLTIEESIAFAPRSTAADAASRALVRRNCSAGRACAGNFANRYPHEISGGQRQRVNNRPCAGAVAAAG